MAQINGLLFMETSCKVEYDKYVKKAFFSLLKSIKNKRIRQMQIQSEIDKSVIHKETLKLTVKKEESSCCN